MSTVSPNHGSSTGGGGSVNNHSYSHHHPSSTPSQYQQHANHHNNHSSSQDGPANLSGMPNTSFDSVSSHHGHQHSSQSHPQSHQAHSQQQQQQQQHQQNSNVHTTGTAGQWGPTQSAHYSSSGATYPSSHGLYSQQGGYYNTQGAHNSTTSTYGTANPVGGPYSGYSMQPHQNAYSLYGGHGASQGGNTSSLQGAPNGSAHHSGNSTPNSATPYSHHSHSTNGGMLGAGQGGYYHQSSGGYYANSSLHSGATTANGVMSQSPSYTSAPQYSTQLPLAGRHRVTTTLWEDEGTLCFQVDARGVCVARRHDNNMINGTKLLNVCGMSRGKRDGILKNEKERVVVKVGAMHLKGVWITFQRGKQLAEQNDIQEVLYPLFETNIQSFLYHPDNYPRTAAVIAAAQERQRSRVSVGTPSPNGYPGPQRAASHAGQIGGPQQNPPPLMRANTTPSGHLLQQGGPMTAASSYHQPNGYTSASNHHVQHSPYAQSHSVSSAREMPATSVDTDGHMSNRLGGAHVDGGSNNTSRDDSLDDFKMSSTGAGKPPLHSSNLLNSSYAFSTPGAPIKYERAALSDRDTVSRPETMISMPHSDPLWNHRSNTYSQ